MGESACTFGRSAQLVGVLTEADPASSPGDTAVLLLNAGLLHRVGPYRLHVELARKLAGHGFPVFRFDLSGLGDSGKHKGSWDRDEQVLSDIGEAMDWVAARTGCRRFVVAGLCTGADHAHKIAVRDERVAGAVFLDGYVYPTVRFRLRRYGPKLINPLAWWRAAMWRARQDDRRVDDYFWVLPPKPDAEADLKRLVARGVHLLYVFSGSIDKFNYAGQIADSFPSIHFGHQLQVEYFKDAQHTYPLVEDRNALKRAICRWMDVRFGGGAGSRGDHRHGQHAACCRDRAGREVPAPGS